ncbi:hypothetical protein F5Y10DRAFT_148842 [Nemania abortiva]|nr:hypothetical protein F5Y10DRAFT_148842 [Nemania abortiva]
MEDRKSELLQYAREYAAANKDLYELLSVSADAAQPEVHRAWRKASLKHHPDKAKNFDAEIWQLFERARDVLSSPEARAAYDSARAAAVQAQKARAALDAKRREMIDDLEARERGVKRKAGGENANDGRHMMTEAEKRILMQKGREHLEKRQRMKDEAEARERERERERTRMEEADRDNDAVRREEADRQPTQQPNSAPALSTIDHEMEDADAHPPPDNYDERIEDIERKLRERYAKRATRKAEKKKKKNRDNSKSQKEETDEAGGKPTVTTTIPTTASTESPSSAPSSMPPPPWPKPTYPTPAGFASTMAKLRAAQREKERKKAEAEAAAAAAATTTTTATPAMTSDG